MSNKLSVDRVRFLAVAAALAGVASFQACTVNNNNTAPDENEGGSGGSNSTAGTHMTAAGADDGGTSGSVAGSSGTVGGANEGGSAQGGATSSVAGAAQGGAAEGGAAQGGANVGGAAQGGAAQGGATTCDDTVGDPACEGVSDDCYSYCSAARANLKPAAAVAAIACLEADTSLGCDTGYSCLAEATKKGCSAEDDNIPAICADAVISCGEPGANEAPCDQLLTGLTDDARAEAVSCINESCYSVYSCVEGLFFL
jgi:hypothetical protein